MNKYFSLLFSVLIIGSIGVAGCGKKEETKNVGPAPASQDLPALFQERNFAESLKYSGAVVEQQPWVGYWWPYVGAGIATGWVDPQGLSPAEKYDMAYQVHLKKHGGDLANYDSLAAWERGRHGPGVFNVQSWYGHCNGWAAASIMVPEPQAPLTVNGVTFEVRDQKAILAESWMEFSGDFVGTRVNEQGDYSSAAFWDIAPAQFHLLLTNVAGRQKHGMILDRHTGHEIWNQPLVAYEIEPVLPEDYLGPHPSFPNIYRVNVSARIWWANDNVSPDDVTPKFDIAKLRDEYFDYFFPGRRLHYELWLDGPIVFDGAGNIVKSGDILVTREDERYVGGVWKNGSNPAALINSHPDYMWVPYGVQHSTGYKNPKIDDGWVRENIGGPHSI